MKVYNPLLMNIGMGFGPMTPAARVFGQPVIPSTICFASSGDGFIGGALPRVSDRGNAKLPSGGSRARRLSDEQIAAALDRASTMTEAAQELSVTLSTISYRIACATEGSALAVFKGKFKRGCPIGKTHNSKRMVSDETLAAVLASAQTMASAATVLGTSRQAIQQRIARAAEDSALTVFKSKFKKGRLTNRQCSDEEIAALLTKVDSIAEAARCSGISQWGIRQQIKRAGADSPLAVFKDAFKGTPGKWTDEEIASALSYAKSVKEASRISGIPYKTLWQRITNAPEGSLLASFKDMFRPGGHKGPRKKKWSDEEIAAVLEDATSILDAKRRSQIPHSTIWLRVICAADDSPLAIFRKKFSLTSRKLQTLDALSVTSDHDATDSES